MNKVILIGNLTREPETGTTKSGIAYCRFCIAVQRDYRDADGNRGADFFNCVAWRNTAEYCGKYLNKGDKVAVTGSIEIKDYEDSKGNKRTSVNINVSEVEFLSQRRDNSTSPNANLTPVDGDDLPF